MTLYFARGGSVFVSDGPWEARLTGGQCDQLLTIWDSANAVSLFNALYDAMREAGMEPCDYARKSFLRVVSAQDQVRRQLVDSVAQIGGEP